MVSKTYTLADLAQLIGIPESTARNYRKRYDRYLETVDDGSRYPRFTESALDALRMISDGYQRKASHQEIEDQLNRHFAQLIEVQEAFATQPPPDSHQTALTSLSPSEALSIVAMAMQKISEDAQEKKALREEVDTLRMELNELREIVNSSSHTTATQQPQPDESQQNEQNQPPDQPPKHRKWWLFGKG